MKGTIKNMIWLKLSDAEWLQTLIDLEDMSQYEDILQQNVRYKEHLETDKRALLLQHLQYQN